MGINTKHDGNHEHNDKNNNDRKEGDEAMKDGERRTERHLHMLL